MPETLAALLFAHVMADFVLQSGWMVANKHRLAGLGAHGAVVLGMLVLALGQIGWALIWLTALHLAIDLAKTRTRPGLAAFLADQGAHGVSLIALALWQPGLWANGLWQGVPAAAGVMALTAGLLLATRASGFAIGLLMQPFATSAPDGLPGGGRVIGWLERSLIFLMVLIGQPEGVGLLIAAKSILRFGAVKDDRAVSEYVIIGTLASFGLALLAAYGTQILLAALPPIGILPTTP